MEVRFQVSAIGEFLQARRYYSRIDPKLGDRFGTAVDVAISRIMTDPNSLSQLSNGFRGIRVKRFPYVLFFKFIEKETVGIYALAHTSRRPGYWRRRQIHDES